MTPEEAIMELELKGGLEITGRPRRLAKFLEALDVAIEALKEVQQYRKIGTVEECREAVGKQNPKKIIIKLYTPATCPTCNLELSESLGDGYYKHWTSLRRCPRCGQRIQWDENSEGMEE